MVHTKNYIVGSKRKRLYAIFFTILLLAASFGMYSLAKPGEPEEIVSMRTIDSKTFLLPNGSYEYVGYASPVHYTDQDGNFSDIQNALITETCQAGGNTYSYKNKANGFNLYFASDSSGEPVRLEKDGYAVSFGYADAGEPVSAVKTDAVFTETVIEDLVEKNTAIVYPGIYPGIDAAYRSADQGVREYLILHSPMENRTFRFRIRMEGLTPEMGVIREEIEDETATYPALLFVNEDRESIFHICGLSAFDQNEAYTTDVEYGIEEGEDGWILSVRVDDAFFENPDLVYPVMIDPDIMVTGSSIADTFVASNNAGTNYNCSPYMESLYVGKNMSLGICRPLIRFPRPSVFDGNQNITITYAKIRLKYRDGYDTPTDIRARRNLESFGSYTATWNNKPSTTTSMISGYGASDGNNWYRFVVTSAVAHQYSSSSLNYGFTLLHSSEYGSSNYSRMYSSDAPSPNKPELRITYTTSTTTPTPTPVPTPTPTPVPTPTPQWVTLNVSLIRQDKSKWCWAACLEMCATYLGYDNYTQWDIVHELKGTSADPYPDLPGYTDDFQSGMLFASNNEYTTMDDTIFTVSQMKAQLLDNKPFIMRLGFYNADGEREFSHSVVGYSVNESTQYIHVRDPELDLYQEYCYPDILDKLRGRYDRTIKILQNN